MEQQGCAVWFTGMAASGKSTIATAVEEILRARGLRVENLDADEVRQNISPDLKWSKADRDMNTKRLAFLGQLLSRNGVVALITAVSSLREFRDRARRMIPRFVEVWARCPVEILKQRDPKGLYARAARGEVNDIAGIHQPWEEPLAAEVVLDTDRASIEECAKAVVAKLEELCYIPACAEEPAYSEEEEERVKARLQALGYL